MERLEKIDRKTKGIMNRNELSLDLFVKRTLTIVTCSMMASTVAIGYEILIKTYSEYIEATKEAIKSIIY